MSQKPNWRNEAVVADHAEGNPSAEERANVTALDEAVKALSATSNEARPRRWITRIGSLLRQVRARREAGQDLVAERAQVTQPYLSRLENGGLSKHGPTIDVLFRCAEALGCDIEVAMRSKANGELLGSVSSADLHLTGTQLSESASVPAVVSTSVGIDKVSLLIERASSRHKAAVWVGTQAPNGRILFKKASPDEKESHFTTAINRFLRSHEHAEGNQTGGMVKILDTEPQTVKVGEGDVVVIRARS